MREEVRKANDPCPEDEPSGPRPQDIHESPLFIILHRLVRHADEDSRPQAVDEMAASARKDSRRYWEVARRFWARTLGEDASAIRLPENMRELEDEFWRWVDATISEALEGRDAEPNEEDEWRAGEGTDCG